MFVSSVDCWSKLTLDQKQVKFARSKFPLCGGVNRVGDTTSTSYTRPTM